MFCLKLYKKKNIMWIRVLFFILSLSKITFNGDLIKDLNNNMRSNESI